MPVWERIQDWAAREIAEVKRAPVALAIVLGLGAFVGWWTAGVFYAERMEVLQAQVAAGRVVVVPAPAVPTPAPPLLPYGSRLVVIGGIAALGALAAALAWQLRRSRTQAAAQYDLLVVAAKQIEQLTDERDREIAAHKDTKHEHAMKVLEAYSRVRFKGEKPTVTVRFAGYGKDYELAERIKGMFTQYVTWAVTLDGSNKPALPRAEQFKVVFDVGMTEVTYGELVHAFSKGELLGVTVGVQQYVDRDDTEHLIVKVLPDAQSGG